jgi:hypothetical protein
MGQTVVGLASNSQTVVGLTIFFAYTSTTTF